MKVLFKANDGTIFMDEEECRKYEKSQKKTSKKNYEVELYYNGYANVFVEANNKEEAVALSKQLVFYEDLDLKLSHCEVTEVLKGC